MAYIITAQPLHRVVHQMLWPKSVDKDNITARAQWGVISIISLLLAFFIANSIPFFEDVQGVIGSLLGAPVMFG